MKQVYVVGLPQSGGCWLCTGRCYTDWNLADEECKKDRAQGIKSQIFTLCVKEE